MPDGKEEVVKRQLPIHPLLFGLFAVLGLYSANVKEVSPYQVLAPTGVVLGCIAMLLFLAWLVYRNVMVAGLAASLIVVLCFSYGHIVYRSEQSFRESFFITPTSDSAVALLLIWSIIGASGAWLLFLYRPRKHLGSLTTVLNVMGAALVIVSTMTVVVNEIRGRPQNAGTAEGTDINLSAPETLPDIYYIILDRYASASTLQEKLNFDNSKFLDYLSSKGFYVAADSRDNYLNTAASLASSLNMEYLDNLAQRVGDTCTDAQPLFAMLRDYKVWRLLKSAGYEFIHFGGWWEQTRKNKYADINVNYGGSLSEFSNLLLGTTAVDPVGKWLGLWSDPRRVQYERTKYEFNRLSQIPDVQAPTFVFAHFLTPHPDYVFESDGAFLAPEEAVKRSVETRYLDQLVATNNLVESCIDRLIAESDVPPIIILQSDEGPYPNFEGYFSWTPSHGGNLDLRVKSGILNAYYFPGVEQGVFYPSITPVNSFRLLFNLYFGTNLALLPDKYYYQYPEAIYRFIDLTDFLKPG
jgi:hypothetical protein